MNGLGWVGRGSKLLAVLAFAASATACAKRNDEPFAPPTGSAPVAAVTQPAAPQASVEPQAAPTPVSSSETLPAADVKTRAQCTAICARSRELHCKQPEVCQPNCLAMQAATPCGAEFSAFYACLVGQPTGHFECDPESGVAQIREGYCEAEQQHTLTCMNEKMKQ